MTVWRGCVREANIPRWKKPRHRESDGAFLSGKGRGLGHQGCRLLPFDDQQFKDVRDQVFDLVSDPVNLYRVVCVLTQSLH